MPLVIDVGEIRREFGARLVGIRGIRLEAPGHNPVEGFRDGRVDCTRRWRRLLDPVHQLRDRALPTSVIARPYQQVAEINPKA